MAIYHPRHFLYGGDYNPDQWSAEVWRDDITRMKELGVNAATLPVFSWAHLQPAEDSYDFAWLDQVLNLLAENAIDAILATPTAAQPAWMSHKYPEMLPVTIYEQKRKHGGRTNFCPNSPVYRRFAANIAGKMAERYQKHPALLLWHISNEYGSYCYCDTCAAAFREWLKQRYGTLEELNRRWYTRFWGHTFYEWEEVEPPSYLNEMFPYGPERTATTQQPMAIDYNRFMSGSLLDCFRNEAAAIRKYTPEVPITTNLMGTFKPLDYFAWAKEMDIASWDSYPQPSDPPSKPAMRHDLTRGLKDGMPFLLMEQTPNQQNWQPVNALKRPGVMRLWSYQAIAHGSDSVLFFQWRQTLGGCEKYHAAMLPHANILNTRIGRELVQLGAELKKLDGKILGSRIEARIALVFDWSNWWAVEYSSGPTIYLKYLDIVGKYYQAIYDLNLPVDIIPSTADFSKYSLVIAPLLYMTPHKTAQKLEAFVAAGGTLLTTFFSGWVDENDLVYPDGYPGALRKLLGVWVEEQDALYPEITNEMIFSDAPEELRGVYTCKTICDVAHAEGAHILATFGKEYYAGQPCVTENTFGKGKALYVASDPEVNLLHKLLHYICRPLGIRPVLVTPPGVEATQRTNGKESFTFILNHNDFEVEIKLAGGPFIELLSGSQVSGTIKLPPKGVNILTG